MTTSHWLRHPSNTPDFDTDVLIIGGGFIGLSTAFWLTEMEPALKVTVLDRSLCGSGASGRNAGFLTMGSASFYKSLSLKWGKEKANEIYKFAHASLEQVHRSVLKQSSSEISFEPTSSMTLFKTEDQLAEWSTPDFLPEDFNFSWKGYASLPLRLQSSFHGAFEASPEFKVNPIQLLTFLKKILRSRKVQIVESTSAFEVVPEGARTEVNTIHAGQVVLALNGYFPQFSKAFHGAIVPRRAQMMAVEIEEEFNCPSLYYDPTERVYWRKSQDNVLLIGGKRLLDEAGETGDYEKVTTLIQQGLEEYLQKHLRLKYKIINRWSGTMGFTEDELPLSGRINAPLETYMIGGFSGHGMGLGFGSAKDMAEVVTGRKKTSFFEQFRKADFTL